MRATLLLCDAAQEVNGKLYILGAGWTRTLQSNPPRPLLMALAAKVFVSWNETNQPHMFRAALLDHDGRQVTLDEGPVLAEGSFEVGRPPGVTVGADLDTAVTITFGGLLLPSGRYRWEMSIDGHLVASEPFEVISPKE